jgi:hypothetical protein
MNDKHISTRRHISGADSSAADWKSAANVGGNRLKTDWQRTCFSGFPPVLAPELHSGAIMHVQIIANNACLSAPEEAYRGRCVSDFYLYSATSIFIRE